MNLLRPTASPVHLTALLVAALAASACSGDDETPGTGNPTDTGDGGGDVGVIDSGDDVPSLDSSDTPRFDTNDEVRDTGNGTGCNTADDCPVGEVCVDLLAGPNNGFCTTRCQNDDQCEEGEDCVVIGDDELSFSACVEIDFCLDEDGDNYGVGPGCLGPDCNDNAASVNPGADELCNDNDDDCDGIVDNNTTEERQDCETGFAGVCNEGRTACISGLIECVARFTPGPEICDNRDNDCDGQVDENASDARTWYRDDDGDRFGNPDATRSECNQPAGYEPIARDCDDTNRLINPSAVEVCDGKDNDCDGEIDGPDARDAVRIYRDADGDGFGDAAVSRTGCPEPGWVTNATDCDDAVVNEGGSTGATPWYRDFDGDGYGDPTDVSYACEQPAGRVADNTDCNDRDIAINPAATEVCDGVDNNCVNGIDEGVQRTFYRDFDRDSRGDPENTTRACTAPAGYVANADDCNDREAAAWTGREEICDGIDNNCVNGIDEGVTTTYYRDADGDGYGDPTLTRQACSLPAGYVANADDCNDGQRQAWTGRAEICDGIDNDCDGDVDEGVSTVYYLDFDGDGRGNPAVSTRACMQPVGYVPNANDCNDGQREAWTGRDELCDGIDNDCDGQIDEGITTTWWLDFDRDGFGDPEHPLDACRRPEGYADNNLDCDDTTELVSPGIPERCGDTLDNDCDPSTPDTCP